MDPALWKNIVNELGDVISAGAAPTAAVVLALIFRKPLSDLIRRIKSIPSPLGDLMLDQAEESAQEVIAQAPQLPARDSTSRPPKPPPGDTPGWSVRSWTGQRSASDPARFGMNMPSGIRKHSSKLYQFAVGNMDPKAQVEQAWAMVTAELHRAAIRAGQHLGPGITPVYVLEKQGLVDHSFVDTWRALRTYVAVLDDQEPDLVSAVRFAWVADALVEVLLSRAAAEEDAAVSD